MSGRGCDCPVLNENVQNKNGTSITNRMRSFQNRVL